MTQDLITGILVALWFLVVVLCLGFVSIIYVVCQHFDEKELKDNIEKLKTENAYLKRKCDHLEWFRILENKEK